MVNPTDPFDPGQPGAGDIGGDQPEDEVFSDGQAFDDPDPWATYSFDGWEQTAQVDVPNIPAINGSGSGQGSYSEDDQDDCQSSDHENGANGNDTNEGDATSTDDDTPVTERRFDTAEDAVEAAAEAIAEYIRQDNSDPNIETREWGALIVEIDGEFAVGGIVNGDNSTLSIDHMIGGASVTLGAEFDVTSIVGSIHFQPGVAAGDEFITPSTGEVGIISEEQAAHLNEVNGYPSNLDYTGIRNAFFALGTSNTQGGQFDPSNTFNLNDQFLAIIAPDGAVRVFNYSDGPPDRNQIPPAPIATVDVNSNDEGSNSNGC